MERTISNLPVVRTEAALRAAFRPGPVHPHPVERGDLLLALAAQRDECLIWPGSQRKGRGRASITVAGRRFEVDVHRAALIAYGGAIQRAAASSAEHSPPRDGRDGPRATMGRRST